MFTGIDALVDEVLVINIVGKYFDTITRGFTLPTSSMYTQDILRKIIRPANAVPIIPARDTRSLLFVASTADNIEQNAANGIARSTIFMTIMNSLLNETHISLICLAESPMMLRPAPHRKAKKIICSMSIFRNG